MPTVKESSCPRLELTCESLTELAAFGGWRFDPLILVILGGSGLTYWYWAGAATASKHGGRRHLPRRAGYFFAGLIVLFVALVSPVDGYADRLLSVHMVQHLLLTLVAPPLLLLGAPITLALQASSDRFRKRVLLPILRSPGIKVLSHPAVGWVAFAAVLWGSHFSPLYETALTNRGVHTLEHAAYVGSALLFWWPIVGADPAPTRLSPPARILYLFLAMPQMTFLGLAIYGSDRVLYPHYLATSARLGTSALSDQHLAGALMWTSGMFLIIPALGVVLLSWLDREDRAGERMGRAVSRPSRAGSE
jgi:cytochrome c oxidase assembly factor CtaG